VPCLLVALPTGRIEAANPAVASLLEVDHGSIVGQRITSLTRGLWRSESMRLLLAGSQSEFAGPTTLRFSDGRLQPCVASVRAMATPGLRWVLALFDVNGTGAAGSLLRASDIDVVVVVGDGEGSIGDVSPNITDLLGYAPGDFIGRPALSLFHADDVSSFFTVTTEAVSSGHTRSIRARVRHADGSWVPLRIFATVLHDHSARALGFVLVPDLAEAGVGALHDAGRMDEVERRLRRIAIEIAALGVGEGLGPEIPPEVARVLGSLSPKRQEIVERLQAGARVPSIAQAMYLSQSTVRNHLSAVFRELGVSSQEELLLLLRS
jgi:PAS domain S-box-containing protein